MNRDFWLNVFFFVVGTTCGVINFLSGSEALSQGDNRFATLVIAFIPIDVLLAFMGLAGIIFAIKNRRK